MYKNCVRSSLLFTIALCTLHVCLPSLTQNIHLLDFGSTKTRKRERCRKKSSMLRVSFFLLLSRRQLNVHTIIAVAVVKHSKQSQLTKKKSKSLNLAFSCFFFTFVDRQSFKRIIWCERVVLCAPNIISMQLILIVVTVLGCCWSPCCVRVSFILHSSGTLYRHWCLKLYNQTTRTVVRLVHDTQK